MTAGRPSKLDNDLASRIIGFLEDGATIRDACAAAGVSTDSFVRWRRKSAVFAAQIEEAQAKVAIICTKTIINAAKMGEWKAALEILKRIRRDEWGDNIALRADKEANELLAELFPGSEGEGS